MASFFKKTKDMVFTEAMDEIMDIFYKPQRGNNRHYCCEPNQIEDIMKLVDDLERCGGDIITFSSNAIPENEIADCINPGELLQQGTTIATPLSSKMMYMCVILCYYISSRIAGSYNFGLQTVLKRLIPGQDAESIVYRSSMAVMISERLLFNTGNSPECEAIIREFKRNLLSLSDFPETTMKKWASYVPKTEAEFASEVAKSKLMDDLPETPEESAAEIDEKTKLVLNEQRGIIQKYLQRKSRVSGGKKLRKNKSRRKNKSKRKF